MTPGRSMIMECFELKEEKGKVRSDFQRTHKYIHPHAGGSVASLPIVSSEEKYFGTAEVYPKPPVLWRGFNYRCRVLTFLTLESDGKWRVVAVPVQCPDQRNNLISGAPVNMDSVHLNSAKTISTLHTNRRKVYRGQGNSSIDTTLRSCNESDKRQQSTNQALQKHPCYDYSHSDCSQGCLMGNNFPGVSHTTSALGNLSASIEAEKNRMESLQKKTRKKGKQKKKLPFDGTNAELRILPNKYGCKNMPCEVSADSGKQIDGSLTNTSSAEIPLPPAVSTEDSAIANSYNTSDSDTPQTSSCLIADMEVSKPTSPQSSVVSLSEEDPIINSDNAMGPNRSRISMDDWVEGFYNNQDFDLHGLPQNDLVTDSPSVDSSGKIDLRTPSTEEAAFNRGKKASLYDLDRDNSDGRLIAGSKKSKHVKAVPNGFSLHKLASVGNLHSHTGKENNQPVWKKVQRKECNYPEKVSLAEVKDMASKEAFLCGHNSKVDLNVQQKNESKKHLHLKASEKVKRKRNPGLKQETDSHPKSGTAPNKAKCNSEKLRVHLNKKSDTISVEEERIVSWNGSNLRDMTTNCGIQSNTNERLNSELICDPENSQDHLQPLTAKNDAANSHYNIVEAGDSSFYEAYNNRDSPNLLSAEPPVQIPQLLNEETAQNKEGKEISILECNKKKHISGSILQKWVPVGTKGSSQSGLSKSNSLLEHFGEEIAEGQALKSCSGERINSSMSNEIFVLKMELNDPEEMPVSEDCSHCEDKGPDELLKDRSSCIYEGQSSNCKASSHLADEAQNHKFSVFQKHVDSITTAVVNASIMGMKSEAVELATGGPIAEFERMLDSSSPLICQSNVITNCKSCPKDWIIDSALCQHETSDVSLGNLWQWYRKHGSFGLEVKGEDYSNSNRMGIDRFAFRAYFVPYLSAIQLFKKSESHYDNSITHAHSSKVLGKGCEGLPPCGRLAPQLQYINQVYNAYLFNKDEVTTQAVESTESLDFEVLFEFFEVEQPQQRQPLYEKIQELVRADVALQSKTYGDSSILNSIKLCDLDPRSWYSVAWYPIYKIPDGNFRAAFLTYHSLGHLVRKSALSNSVADVSWVSSPVVGLQSYNAQGECWFRLRPSAQNRHKTTNIDDPSKILKERLRTLEETASRMATAIVSKGNVTSVNRHPDYEFFLSRRCY